MIESLATMFVFAGNNGSGKSTIRNLIVDRLGVSVNIDPDALARGIDRENPERRKVSAGKEAIKLIRECIHHKRDFSVETTLAGGNVIRQMREAKANGFEIIMFYVGLGDVRLNIERVAARVRNGGHHIETEDILRRHQTSINNLLDHLELINHLIVIDNSGAGGEIVVEADWTQIKHYADVLPEWVQLITQELGLRNNKRE
ncbi:zeta toxin family protein [Paenibacillus sp. LHD-117]|uniref:zeta toxin family protein n=1 Tax=Paenibacillus sp. LHD-117 TaxID=3071412 RepID=UPI0027E11521|nr:zeta toxin family protein [Paenibacillus sp. LHD-117]MDQ6417919.1 zeta toxin family protein [Paenibacillus sp. LHD-117]